jgi:molybdopterin-guanine dinucleotide biosynthesis protein A
VVRVVYDAVVLAGGTARRLGGTDKAGLEVAGRTLLDRALSAVADARSVVVVGDRVPTGRRVVWAREEPAYGGPVAAAYAGLDALGGPGDPADTVVVLAVDMPGVTASTVARLLDGGGSRDGAGLTGDGRRHLALAVSRAALDRIRPAETGGMALRDLLRDLDLADVPALGDEAADVDTWTEVAHWRRRPADPTRPTVADA